MTSRTLPVALAIAINAGSDPDVIDIEDATEVYLDWPDVTEPCAFAPAGQCQYGPQDNYRRCIHCGRRSELDE